MGTTMPLSDDTIDAAGKRYWRESDRYAKLAELVGNLCREIVSENVLRASVHWRAKTRKSFVNKLREHYAKDEKISDSVEAVFARVGDLSAVRVLTYVESDRPRVVDLISKAFEGPGGGDVEIDIKDKEDDELDPKDEKKNKKKKTGFYRATHCQVAIPQDLLVESNENLLGLTCEIQVCSMLAHVWNELEHDLIYKPQTGDPTPAEHNAIATLGHQTLAGDGVIVNLLELVEARQRKETDPFADEYDFVPRVRPLFPDANDFKRHAGQLFQALRDAGIDNPEQLRQQVLDGVESPPEKGAELVSAFLESIGGDWSEVYEPLNDETSDLLLVMVLRRFAQKIVDSNPSGRGHGRPKRFVYAARRWIDVGMHKAGQQAVAADG